MNKQIVQQHNINTQMQQQWLGLSITNYVFCYQNVGFSPKQSLKITVCDQRVIQAYDSINQRLLPDSVLCHVPTIDSLFAGIETYLKANCETNLTVKYDTTFHFPISFFASEMQEGWGYTISSFVQTLK